jgi:hypothetical protein
MPCDLVLMGAGTLRTEAYTDLRVEELWQDNHEVERERRPKVRDSSGDDGTTADVPGRGVRESSDRSFLSS